MKKYRIGKDIAVRWPVLTNGEAQPLEGRDLTLICRSGAISRQIAFTAEGNVLEFTIFGTQQKNLGSYSFTLWENMGKPGQTAVDYCNAFSLVSSTCMEGGDDNGIETGTALTLEASNIETGIKGKDGLTPYIGSNGHWWIGDEDTGTVAEGKDGKTPEIGANGNWWIGDADTGKPSRGEKGDPFTYSDFTPEQIAELQKPAADMIAELEKTDEAAKANEDIRVENEKKRQANEIARQDAFSKIEGDAAELSKQVSAAGDYAKEQGDYAKEVADAISVKSPKYVTDDFVISREFMQAKGLRYIAFREVLRDNIVYLLTAGRVLKFNMDTYEVYWDTALPGVSSWHIAGRNIEVIGDVVYVLVVNSNLGLRVLTLDDNDGGIVSDRTYEGTSPDFGYMHPFSIIYNGNVLFSENSVIYSVREMKQICKTDLNTGETTVLDTVTGPTEISLSRMYIQDENGTSIPVIIYMNGNDMKVVTRDAARIITIRINGDDVPQANNVYSLILKTMAISYLCKNRKYYFTNTAMTKIGDDLFEVEADKMYSVVLPNNIGYYYLSYDTYANSIASPGVQFSRFLMQPTSSVPQININIPPSQYHFMSNHKQRFMFVARLADADINEVWEIKKLPPVL